jgi:hypothetical protein
MMALLLGHLTHSIHKSERGLEIRELEGTHNVMLVDDVPLRGIGQLTMKLGKFLPLQRRYAAVAGNTFSVCEHSVCPKRGF